MTEAETESADDSENRSRTSILDRAADAVHNHGRPTWIRRIAIAALTAGASTALPVGPALGQLQEGIEFLCATPLGSAVNLFIGLLLLAALGHSMWHGVRGLIALRPGGGGMQGQSKGRTLVMSSLASFVGFLLLLGYPAMLTYFGQELTGCVAF